MLFCQQPVGHWSQPAAPTTPPAVTHVPGDKPDLVASGPNGSSATEGVAPSKAGRRAQGPRGRQVAEGGQGESLPGPCCRIGDAPRPPRAPRLLDLINASLSRPAAPKPGKRVLPHWAWPVSPDAAHGHRLGQADPPQVAQHRRKPPPSPACRPPLPGPTGPLPATASAARPESAKAKSFPWTSCMGAGAHSLIRELGRK